MNDIHQPEGTQPRPTETRDHVKQLAIRSLAIVGIVALLALGTWGTIQIIRTGPSVFSGIGAAVSNFTARFFPAGSPSLRITLESYSVMNDEAFDLTWNSENAPRESFYAFVYECADGLSFLTPNTTGGNTRIACGETYEFNTQANQLTLIPISLDNRFLDSAVKVLMVTGNQIVAEDEVLLTVVNDKVAMSGTTTGTTTKPVSPQTRPSTGGTTGGVQATYYEPVYTTVTVPRTSDPNGYVDLAVEIIRIGTLDGRSDRFSSNDSTLDRDERGGVMFAVRNLGTKVAEDWTFEAELPTRPSFTYRSRSQPDLMPGDRIEFTLGFDRLSREDEDEILIEIDPRNTIDESNESNNRADIRVEIE